VGRGERPIKLGNSSYSPKCIEVQRLTSFIEVELLIGCGGFTAYQFLTNSECYKMLLSSEGMGAKVHVREGKNPDHQLRSPSIY
jgi:hypothetical protein